MNNLFEKIKIRKIILAYICATILTFIIISMPFINDISLKDKNFKEIILNLLIFIWFYIMLSKEGRFIKGKRIAYIKNINYKKIAHLYFLNIGLYIGTGLCLFIGDGDVVKLPSMMYYISAITLAPIVEELIFRGVILNRLKIKFNITSAIFISSITFSVLHFDLNIIGRLIFGALSAILFFQTGNIINCIILHALNNLSVLIFPTLSYYTNFSIITNGEFTKGMVVLITLSFFMSSIILSIIYIKNNLPKTNDLVK